MCAAPVRWSSTAGLGTLNHTALTCEALAARQLELAGVAIGSWPRHPGLAERENRSDLETLVGRPLAGALPEGSGALTRAEFHAMALRHLGPEPGRLSRPSVLNSFLPFLLQSVLFSTTSLTYIACSSLYSYI